MSDRASQVLAQERPAGVPNSLRALADYADVPRTTLQHRARGRRSLEAKAASQHYLRAAEEKALVNYLIQQDALGFSVRIKYVPSIAFGLACKRCTADRPKKPPGKNWVQFFYKRHADELKPSKSRALEWDRYSIYDKVAQWFDVVGEVLRRSGVDRMNVYNVDETGVMLSKPGSVKVLVGKDNSHGYRGARVRRQMVTAIECISADGRVLDPMIIWPAKTHRSNWTTYPTPGWHYAFSDNGYTDSYLSLQWIRLVFDPQTQAQAQQKPRVLVCDGFGTHETLEILEFCFNNNIILCRLPSHTSHKLQPCDVSVFAPLKTAYRDQVERLERGCVGAIGKQHFTYLYSPARQTAFSPRNIRAAWAGAGLYPFNPARVMDQIPKPVTESRPTASNTTNNGYNAASRTTPPHSPSTPQSTDAVASLHNVINGEIQILDAACTGRLRRYVQKLTDATQLSFAERTLLQDSVRFLSEINNEAKVRRSTNSSKIGTARVMSFEDLESARAERAVKEAAKRAAHDAREAKKAEKAARAAVRDERSQASKAPLARKSQVVAATGISAPSEEVVQDSPMDVDGGASRPWQAPVARMW